MSDLRHKTSAKSNRHPIHTYNKRSPSTLPLVTQKIQYKEIQRLNSIAERTCGCCKSILETVKGLESHTKQKPECRRWMKQKAKVEDFDFDDLKEGVSETIDEKGEAMDVVREVQNNGDESRRRKRKRARSSVGSEAYAVGVVGDKGEGSSGGEYAPIADEEGPVEGAEIRFEEGEEDVEVDGADIRDAYDEFTRDYYHFIPAPPPPPLPAESSMSTDAGPSQPPISHPEPLHKSTSLRLDDDEDERLVEESAKGGKRIKLGDSLYQRWKEQFDRLESERGERERKKAERKAKRDGVWMDDEEEAASDQRNVWAPFASKRDWCIAKWAIEEGIGNGKLDRLLEIEGVSHSINKLITILISPHAIGR